MRPGDRIEVTIDKGVYRGLGLGRHQGQVVLVGGAYPGERWHVRVSEVARGFVRAEAEELSVPSPLRRSSPCPAFPACGGCAHQDLSYDGQLALKRAVLEDALLRAGVSVTGEIPIIGSPETEWRTRASLHVQARSGAVRLGFHRRGSHEVVEFAKCLQLSQEMNATITGLRAQLVLQPEVAARTERIELAETIEGDRRVAALVGRLSERDGAALRRVSAEFKLLDGLGVVEAGRRGRFIEVKGDPHLISRVQGFSLRAHVLSFFQANRFLAARLVGEVLERVPPSMQLLDLYGGVGLLSLPLSARAPAVVCVELDEHAARDARANVRAAGLANVRVLRCDAGASLAQVAASSDEVIVVDPPRVGLDRAVIDGLARRGPKCLVYVSCDPPTLARDVSRLQRHGYRVAGGVALDLFPNTFHVETVVRLERAE